MSETPLEHQYGGYAAAITTLARSKVEFVVCGGVASVFYGVPRSTLDLDILVRMSDENLGRLIEAAKALGLRPRVPEPIEALKDSQRRRFWIETKHAKVYTLQSSNSPLQIDVFLEYPLSYDEVSARARLAWIDDVRFKISSAAHLIQAKRAVRPMRETDQFDINHLQRILDRDEPF